MSSRVRVRCCACAGGSASSSPPQPKSMAAVSKRAVLPIVLVVLIDTPFHGGSRSRVSEQSERRRDQQGGAEGKPPARGQALCRAQARAGRGACNPEHGQAGHGELL